MSSVETYGGNCPNCTKPMLQKYESGLCGFIFDACPHCGFVYGTEDNGVEMPKGEVWDAIFEAHNVSTFPELLALVLLYEPSSEFVPSIFNYGDDTHSEILSRCVDTTTFKLPR